MKLRRIEGNKLLIISLLYTCLASITCVPTDSPDDHITLRCIREKSWAGLAFTHKIRGLGRHLAGNSDGKAAFMSSSKAVRSVSTLGNDLANQDTMDPVTADSG